jgi:single-stranded-DNA-specific exonuclease
VTNVLWQAATVDQTQVDEYSREFHLPPRVARWLCLRNVTREEVAVWLNPERADWTNPDDFTDMQRAVHVISDGIRNRVKICIVGDYDVDGVTSSTIVASTLDALGADWTCIIPHRIDDGYGLSVSLVERAHALGCGMIVTVDNGIRAVEAIQVAVQLGMRVVLTDHHEPGDTLPTSASAIVHWMKSESEETALLSGAGVSWKLATALLDGVPAGQLGPEFLQALRDWHIALAGLGALADVMPMRGENRKLVSTALRVFRRCDRVGWRALCEVAGVQAADVTDTVLGWSISPRLNAAGRMGSAEAAFSLLMTTDSEEARSLATQIEEMNRDRKRETDRVYHEAVAAYEQEMDGEQASIIVVAGQWSLGVVGIVAARLVGQYGLPAIVLADDGSDVLRGSGRAPDGFSLHDTLLQCEENLVHFGGHEAAVGCAVHRDSIAAFREAAGVVASQTTTSQEASPALADDFLPLTDVNLETCAWLQKFSPFGPQNPAFRFYIGPVEVIQVTPMGKEQQHLRIKIREGTATMDMVWFQAPPRAHQWVAGMYISAVCLLEENTWQGNSRAQLRVESASLLERPLLRDDFGAVYRILQARRKLSAQEATTLIAKHRHAEAHIIFDTFVELGFAHWQESAYHVVEQVHARDLRDSQTYQKHLWASAGGSD